MVGSPLPEEPMAKMRSMKAVGCIQYGKDTYQPGETFSCDIGEAKRLEELEVAVPASPATAPPPEDKEKAKRESEAQVHADLLAKIANAANEDELAALMPEEEPADPAIAEEIRIAAEKRLAELQA